MIAVSGRALGAALVVAAIWVAWGLAMHPAFQPAHLLRVAAPLVALLIGAAFTRLVALTFSSPVGVLARNFLI